MSLSSLLSVLVLFAGVVPAQAADVTRIIECKENQNPGLGLYEHQVTLLMYENASPAYATAQVEFMTGEEISVSGQMPCDGDLASLNLLCQWNAYSAVNTATFFRDSAGQLGVKVTQGPYYDKTLTCRE